MAKDDSGYKKKESSGLAFIFIIIGFAILVFSAGFTQIALLAFVLFGSIAMIMGLSMSAESRAFLGIPFIIMFLLIFTSQYPSIMGQALFGYWWPQVEAFGESFIGPLNTAIAQAQQGMSDAWLMVTNPQEYYLRIAERDKVQKSVVQEGGSVLSIETSKFESWPSTPGILEPSEPLIGSIELINSGEYNSEYMELKVWASWKDEEGDNPIDDRPMEDSYGEFQKVTCSGITDGDDSKGKEIATCVWDSSTNDNEMTYPKQVRPATFVYAKERWGILQDCEKDDKPIECDTDGAVYVRSGEVVKMNANVTYKYKVNVSIPVEVIGSNTYVNLLQNKKIQLIDLTSQYTGGPVKATIWTPKQPLRTGESTLVMASVYNDGSGVIKSVDYIIAVPDSLSVDTDTLTSSFKTDSGGEGCSFDEEEHEGYKFIICKHDKNEIRGLEYKRVSFFVTPGMDEDIERTTTLITGYVDYTYLKTTSHSLTVSNNPPQ